MKPHWTQAVESHPVARLIVPCLVPPGKEMRDVIDMVEIGTDSLRATLLIGRSHSPQPMTGSGMAFRIVDAIMDPYPDMNFSVTYEARASEGGVHPKLAIVVEWKNA